MKKVINLKKLASFSLKSDLKMRLTLFLFVFSLFQLQANETYAQKTKISMSINNKTLENVFDNIESLTDFKFIYKDKEVDYQRIVSVNVRKKKLSVILNKLFDNSNTTYKILNKQIVITKKTDATSLVKNEEEVTKSAFVQFKVSGLITDKNNEPLPGATITIKGTKKGTSSDFDGKYSLNVADDNAVLVVSFVGFVTKEIPVQGKSQINIQLEEGIATLDEVVVIGYGTTTKANLLGAVGSLKASDIKELPVAALDDALTGRVAGVQVVSDGTPGSSSVIRIRGIGSLTAGRNPLIVVDGYPLDEGVNLNAIDAQDIESMDVLKDAASTAIYGSRGANGVIIVTTKSGKTEKPQIKFSTYSGFQSVSNPIKLVDAYQYAQFNNEARDWAYVLRDPNNRSFSDSPETKLANGDAVRPDYWTPYLEGKKGLVNNNWLDDIFQHGSITNHSVSVSGKSKGTNWYVALGHFNREGIIIGTHYKRYSAKFKLSSKINDRIKFGLNLAPHSGKTKYAVEGWNNSPISMAMLMQPFYTPYNDAGELNISQQIRGRQRPGGGPAAENPVATATLRDDHGDQFRIYGNAFLEFELMEGLKLKTLLGGDFNYYLRETFQPSTVGEYRLDAADAFAKASQQTRKTVTVLSENTLNYNRKFDQHNVKAVAGYSYQKNNYKKTSINAPELDNDDIQNTAGTSITTSSERLSEWALISYFGRVRYSFDSRYLFSGSIRTDGSSRFGDDTKFGVFPAVSAGWNVSNEDFFPEESFINRLKLRYSWGKSGNNQIGDFGAISTLAASNGYINDELAPGLYPNTSPNSDLSWETTITNNLGIDLGFFNNKLNLNVDLFKSNTHDMLLNVPVPQHSGYNTSLQNIGRLENKGIEVVLSTKNINLGQVKWSTSLNFSKVESEVLELARGQNQIITGNGLIRVGDPIGQVYGYVAGGIFKTQEEVDAAPTGSGTLGQVRILNMDENTDVIDAGDRVVIGNALPDFTYGIGNNFSYKGLSLNVFMDGVSGVDLFDSTATYSIDGQAWGSKQESYFNDRWHPDNNPNGNSPRAGGNSALAAQSTYSLQDGSFFRIRNITLGYNLPNYVINKLGMEALRLYVTAKDPFLFTKFRGFNPEQSTHNPLNLTGTIGRTPLSKSFVIGLNFTL